MLFEPIKFSQLNEADVREKIVAPLLRRLGYRSGTSNNIIREQLLRYPRVYLGRKDQNKDPELRGKADYICEVDRRIRWTIEAKSPAREISTDDIEQAYTYSNHPEIRAVYFCICNGFELRVYQTSHAPDHPPTLSISYMEFDEKFDIIENLLSPRSICRDFPTQILDTGKPLGPNLRSFVRITGGYIHIIENSLNLHFLKDQIYSITGGAVERDENGQLIAFIKTRSPFGSIQRLNEKLGLSESEFTSKDNVISEDPSKPTKFFSSRKVYFSKGEKILNLLNWEETELPYNLSCHVDTFAEGVLVDQEFSGKFEAKLNYSGFPLIPNITVKMDGKFGVHLA